MASEHGYFSRNCPSTAGITTLQPFNLPDEEWYSRLKASASDSSLGLPGFPSDELQIGWIGSAGAKSLAEAFSFYKLIKNKSDLQLGPILDFGCGYGRMIRFFLNVVSSDQLYGVDVNPDILEELYKTHVPGKFSKIDTMGKLPFPDGYFGIVYAYSVFTHLPENVQDHWLAEIVRVMKPGGVFVATVESPRVFNYFRSVDYSDTSLHPWIAGNGRRIQTDPQAVSDFNTKGFYFLSGTPYYGDAFMTHEYVHSHWGRWFVIDEILDEGQQFFQAVVIARSRT